MEDDNPLFDFIKGLDIELSEKGLEPSDLEHIDDDTEDMEGNVIKITFELNMFMNHRKDRYFMLTSNQKLQTVGKMTLSEALTKFNAKKPPRRRR